MWVYRNVKVHWLGHDGFAIVGSKSIVIDPYRATGIHKVDLILITHEHYDHLSPADIGRFSSESTKFVASRTCKKELSKLNVDAVYLPINSKTEISGISIETVPAYNLNKFKATGQVFHPKDGGVGYVITLDGVRFYHAGDTDAIPEMGSIDVDVAFLPVSGTYVMTAEEAAEALKMLKTKYAIPMHIESIVGTLDDAKRFQRLAPKNVQVVIPSIN
jgi:L-ascorbate metabolism protein UlaG (beta-lactamase superfamily)